MISLSLKRGISVSLAGLAMIAAMLLATPAQAAPPIIGGSNAVSAPWAARVFLNGQGVCSATIIAPSYVLTAKHCVANAGTYTFRIGSVDAASGGTVASTAAITRHPTADLAIVRLTFPVLAIYSPLSSTNVAVGQGVRIYGWGATSACGDEALCQSRFLKVATMAVFAPNCGDLFGGVAICAAPVTGVSAGGDSGGPMFAANRQVGVSSASDRATWSSYTNITTPSYRLWIFLVSGA